MLLLGLGTQQDRLRCATRVPGPDCGYKEGGEACLGWLGWPDFTECLSEGETELEEGWNRALGGTRERQGLFLPMHRLVLVNSAHVP